MRTFIFGKKAVSPVIGTILMVAVTVIMAAIVGGFVYQTGRPKVAPNISSTLEDDERVVLANGQNDGRVAKLTFEGGKNIAKSELKAIATYTDDATGAEFTVILEGGSWVIGTATAMGTDRIKVNFIDSDGSLDISPGDRLDFSEGGAFATAGHEVVPGTDFTVKVIHKPTESIVANHTIKVY